MGLTTTRPRNGLGFKTRPKFWPTGWTYWPNHYLHIMFMKFSGMNPLVAIVLDQRLQWYVVTVSYTYCLRTFFGIFGQGCDSGTSNFIYVRIFTFCHVGFIGFRTQKYVQHRFNFSQIGFTRKFSGKLL